MLIMIEIIYLELETKKAYKTFRFLKQLILKEKITFKELKMKLDKSIINTDYYYINYYFLNFILKKKLSAF